MSMNDEQPDEPPPPEIPGATIAQIERYAILVTLRAVGGNQRRAARILGISTRKIHYRLKEYGVHKRDA